MDADWISWTTDLIESNGEAGEPTYSKDYTVPTPLTVVRIFQPPGDPAEKLSAPISFPVIDFDDPTPVTVMGQPKIPAILPVLTDPVSELLLQTSNGTKNLGRVLANGAKYQVTTPVVHAELLPDDPVGQAVVINTFWIEDCINEDCLVEIEIYHLPIKFQNSQIFAGLKALKPGQSGQGVSQESCGGYIYRKFLYHHPGWIAKSEQTYHFDDERIFEWGNPASNDSISKEEAKIAAAAYYWRTIRNRGLSTGPFQGSKAALYLRKKNVAFQQLIEAGGGEMIAPE
ncbi:hypothetical protein DAPPUDRAFT_310711 [Daphnia pulex]|uniref:BRCT domain-containing protein n=1 Tax=Daphnia pulex TaxID=6669 RepID=E9FV91_DAPPU|nr:hypothetical protein DAPPUDRAFT_310711 [Daphnia pulex]|eukprot:EFX89149.1 hypothetical protein DAPPUDRAFT_310711 [Daphnia pulex]